MRYSLSAPQYARLVAIRFALLLAVTVAFPFFVYAAILATDAQKVGGASGALAVILGVTIKPVIYFAFAASLWGISRTRAAAAGLPRFVGVLIVVLVLCDWQFGVTIGSHWGVAFSLGILRVSAVSLTTALIAILTLVFLRDEAEERPEAWQLAYRVWVSLLMLFSLLGLVNLAGFVIWLPGTRQVIMPLVKIQFWLRTGYLYPYALLAAFVAASAYLVIVSRRGQGGRPEPLPSGTARSPAPRFGQAQNAQFSRRN